MLLVFPLADTTRGSKRWIEIGPFQFQPSEFGKLLFVLALAGFLADRARRLGDPRVVLQTIALAAVPVLLVFLQPDLGTSLVYVAALTAGLFVAGIRWAHLAALVSLAALAFASVVWFLPAAGIEVLKPYQVDRLTAFANRDRDLEGVNYNLNQSITAVGSGGLDGRGVDAATQTRLDYLPEHATDFVFASLAEQRGFFGAALLLGLYLLVVWRGLRVITVSRDAFGAIAAGGIVVAFLFQVFVNVGMTMGIAPVTGIPLPFVTVGGSSMVANLRRDRRAPGDPRARPHSAGGGRADGAKLSPMVVWGLVKELRAAAEDTRPLHGQRRARRAAREGARARRRAGRGARRRPVEDAAVLVRVLGGAPTEEDEQELRAAKRARVPVVVVQTGTEIFDVPVRARDRRRHVLGRARGSRSRRSPPPSPTGSARRGTALAARLPVLREPVCRGADRAVLAPERDHRRRGLRARRGLRGADAEPDPPRAPARRGARGRDRPEPPARGARDGRRRVRLPCRSRGRCSASSRSPAGSSRAGSPTRARAPSARPRTATSLHRSEDSGLSAVARP